jgi:hypothetical protein
MSELITSPIPPDLRSLLTDLKKEIFYGLNCHQVGVINSFDPTTQTATVQIQVLRNIGNTQVAYPLLTDCPVIFPSGGGAYMTFPVAKGDPCLVLFNDRDLDLWFTTGNVVGPNSARAHSLSDGIVLVGIRNKTNPPPYTANDAVMLALGTASVKITTAGVVRITKGSGYVEVSATGVAKLHGANGAEVVADTRVAVTSSVSNTSLRTALEQLSTVMTAWVNTGGSTPNPATLTAITNWKNYVQALLDT